ncbi:MAG TPA: 5'/3'-nucleotidase SurE [Spongiibacteraceae bacterium]|nr:5'/3'-nucleotidase SurE [Spongiibacteraceae bacterium]
MTKKMLAAVSLAVLVLLGGVPAHALDILLTNDDGWSAPGIQRMYAALHKAGHKVTLVAPLGAQSGQGGAMNIHVGGYVDVVRQGDNMWSVDGTPVDAVRAGLDVILDGRRPDLVLSGPNFGQNLAAQTAHQSGTVNAALEAMFRGYSAIAVSVGIDIDERNAKPAFGSTLAAFDPTAELVIDLLRKLEANGADRLLPAGLALNINVPVPFAGHRGMRLAPLAGASDVAIHWQRGEQAFGADGGKLQVMMHLADSAQVPRGSDIDLFRRGYITVTPLDGRGDTLVAVPGLAEALH